MEFLEYLGTNWQIQIFVDRELIILRANRGKEIKYFTLKGEVKNKNDIDSFTYLDKKQRAHLPIPKDYKSATFEELKKARKWYGGVSFKVFPFANRQEIYDAYLKKYLSKKRGRE